QPQTRMLKKLCVRKSDVKKCITTSIFKIKYNAPLKTTKKINIHETF
ncbi:unnamed protein product, partial [marine sediment metagenome]